MSKVQLAIWWWMIWRKIKWRKIYGNIEVINKNDQGRPPLDGDIWTRPEEGEGMSHIDSWH